ncbi:MAG: DUF3267 domain-containing protein [Defluviitaleaceae bacterium]|nr:DUF3267 domain-containing protein [Defluviitaleaceae bacterium]
MKISRQRVIDYETAGYGAAEGWTPAYDWEETKKVLRKGNIVVPVFIAAAAFLLSRFVFAGSFDASRNLLALSVLILIYILFIVPLHEILHLMAYDLNIFSNKFNIFIGWPAVSAFYDGETSRTRAVVSLLLPFAVITALLGAALIFFMRQAEGMALWISLLMLINAGGSWTDLFMFFRYIKKTPKGAVFYGNRYKGGNRAA